MKIVNFRTLLAGICSTIALVVWGMLFFGNAVYEIVSWILISAITAAIIKY